MSEVHSKTVGRVSDSVTRQANGMGVGEMDNVGLRLPPNPTYEASAKKPLILPLFAGAVRPEWPWHRLDEIADMYDCPHSTPALVEDTSAPFVVRSQDVRSGSFLTASAARVSQDTYADRIKRVEPRFGDLVYSREDTYFGIAAEVPRGIKVRLGQRMVLIRPDAVRIDHSFLKYWLNSPLVFGHIHGFRDGTVAERLNLPVIRGLPVALPSVAQQGEMAETLTALDDRIALLRETNATLEAIAQALFKSWFVDFDPVHAKQQGRIPEGMDEATAALFPDNFEKSELGLVPRGWRVTPVYDLATYINGAAYKAFEPNSECRGLPIIKIAELKAGVTSQTAYSDVAMPEKYRIDTGDILFSWSGNPDTSIDTFVWHHGQAWLNQHIFRVIPHADEERSFVLQMLKSLRPTFAELARNKQTTGLDHVTVADMKRLLVIYPDKTALDLFDETVSPIHERMFENEKQAQTLATLRDTLLPRLISGQLRLPEAEALINQVPV